MARYIDADKAIARLKASPIFQNICLDGYFIREAVCDLLNNMPTVDASQMKGEKNDRTEQP